MKLPNSGKALVPKEKITDYLLSGDHLAGRAKAKFFLQFGFKPGEWRILAESLVEHASGNDIKYSEKTDFGEKYIIEGKMATPSGRKPLVRSLWFIGSGESVPRFITAYPLKGGGEDERT